MKSPCNQSLNKLHWYVVLQIDYNPPQKKNQQKNKTKHESLLLLPFISFTYTGCREYYDFKKSLQIHCSLT